MRLARAFFIKIGLNVRRSQNVLRLEYFNSGF